MIGYLIAGLLVCVAVVILVKKVRDTVKGKTSCGCGCDDCTAKCDALPSGDAHDRIGRGGEDA